MIPGTRLELVRPKGRGILSPLRLPIPPPGRDSVFKLHGPAIQALGDESRRALRRALSTLSLARTKLLCTAAHLVLKPEKLGPLNRREKLCQITLLILYQVQPLSLELQGLIEKLRYFLLVGLFSRKDLGPQCAPNLALTHDERSSLLLISPVRGLELLHLAFVEIEPALNDLSGAFSQSLLEHLPSWIRIRRAILRLCREQWDQARQRNCKRESNDSCSHQ